MVEEMQKEMVEEKVSVGDVMTDECMHMLFCSNTNSSLRQRQVRS